MLLATCCWQHWDAPAEKSQLSARTLLYLLFSLSIWHGKLGSPGPVWWVFHFGAAADYEIVAVIAGPAVASPG